MKHTPSCEKYNSDKATHPGGSDRQYYCRCGVGACEGCESDDFYVHTCKNPLIETVVRHPSNRGIPVKPVDENSKWTHHKDRGRCIANDSTSVELLRSLVEVLADMGEEMAAQRPVQNVINNNVTEPDPTIVAPYFHEDGCSGEVVNNTCMCRARRSRAGL